MSCPLCKIVKQHVADTSKIITNARRNHRDVDAEEFRTREICKIQSPTGYKPINLNDIKKKFETDFPSCEKDFQCVPENPYFYDRRAFEKAPTTRAIDVENRLKNLEKKVNEKISTPPFDCNDDTDAIRTKTVHKIEQSLHEYIDDLKLTNNDRVRKNVSTLINNRVKGSLPQLKSQEKALETIKEIQKYTVNKINENSEEAGFYRNR